MHHPQRRKGRPEVKAALAAYTAQLIPWETFVARVLAVLTVENMDAVRRAMGDELFWRLAHDVVERDPSHWLRGLGDNDAAKDLALDDDY